MIGEQIPKYQGVNDVVHDTLEEAMLHALSVIAKGCMSDDYAKFAPCFLEKMKQYPEILEWMTTQVFPQQASEQI